MSCSGGLDTQRRLRGKADMVDIEDPPCPNCGYPDAMGVSFGAFEFGPIHTVLRCHRCNMDRTLEGDLIEESRQFEITYD